jgi:hypothetical protein
MNLEYVYEVLEIMSHIIDMSRNVKSIILQSFCSKIDQMLIYYEQVSNFLISSVNQIIIKSKFIEKHQ